MPFNVNVEKGELPSSQVVAANTIIQHARSQGSVHPRLAVDAELGRHVDAALGPDRTGRDLGVADHGGIVIDEIAAMLLMLFFTGTDLARIALAFLLFRLFDILKPPPIRAIDARMKSGIGVMVDDLVAAAMALVVFAVIQRVTGWPA